MQKARFAYARVANEYHFEDTIGRAVLNWRLQQTYALVAQNNSIKLCHGIKM